MFPGSETGDTRCKYTREVNILEYACSPLLLHQYSMQSVNICSLNAVCIRVNLCKTRDLIYWMGDL